MIGFTHKTINNAMRKKLRAAQNVVYTNNFEKFLQNQMVSHGIGNDKDEPNEIYGACLQNINPGHHNTTRIVEGEDAKRINE